MCVGKMWSILSIHGLGVYGDVELELIIWLLALLARGLAVQGVFESPQHGIDDKIRMTTMNEPSTRNKLVSQPLEVLATEQCRCCPFSTNVSRESREMPEKLGFSEKTEGNLRHDKLCIILWLWFTGLKPSAWVLIESCDDKSIIHTFVKLECLVASTPAENPHWQKWLPGWGIFHYYHHHLFIFLIAQTTTITAAFTPLARSSHFLSCSQRQQSLQS